MRNKDVKCKVHINNVRYELDYYTVVRTEEHEFWFYSTFPKDRLDDAVKSAESVPNGFVLQTGGIK